MAQQAVVEDLYAGLALPSASSREAKKRAAEQETVEGIAPVAAAEAPSGKRRRTNASATDLSTMIARLQTHMLVDKKFPKAAALFTQLVREQMNLANFALFETALSEMIAAKGGIWTGKPAFAELIQEVLRKLPTELPDQGGTRTARLEDWTLLAITHHELFTDDTFQFVRAAKKVGARVEAMTSVVAEEEEEEEEDDAMTKDGKAQGVATTSSIKTSTTLSDKHVTLLMPLLHTLFKRHNTAWAKTAVEGVLGVCTRKRLLFPEPFRAEIDQWTTAMRQRRHAPTQPRSAASDARRNIIAMAPGASSSQAGTKVGRSNHPLFNRDL